MGLQYIVRASLAARVILLAAAAQSAASAQVIVRGVLFDDANGARLRGTVMLVDPSTDAAIVHATTDTLGQFSLKTSSGTFQIAAVRPGYTSVLSAPVTAQNGERFTVNIPIAASGDPRHQIAVVEHVRPQGGASPRPNGLTADGMESVDAEEFQYRKLVGTGLHYSRKDFDKANANTLGEFLQSIPGLSVGNPASTSTMQMTRSAGMNGLSSRLAPGASCHMGWFVDGHRMDLPGQIDPITDGLGGMQLGTISAIEVFRGLSEMPSEFAEPDLRCGAVAIWTKRG
ncbi:MAG TPA: TonB-dependent receptor plug domain-containing protein [Gemmatimonadaceae bacterium]